MTKPNFFIVGAAKSGTTSLYQYLVQHPNICMPALKEPHFFGEYRPPGPLIEDMNHYLSLFKHCELEAAVGEASTAYLYSPSAAMEIKQAFPESKIIIVLRNPIDRAYSLFWNHVRDGVEKLSFEAAIDAEYQRRKDNWSFGFHYVASGMYADQVKRYIQTFDEEAIKTFLFEDLKRDSSEVLRQCCNVLGVDSAYEFTTTKIYNRSGPPKLKWIARFLHNSSSVKRWLLYPFPKRLKEATKLKVRDLNIDKIPAMRPETRQKLIEIFSDDIKSLEDLINRDLSHWLEKPE